MNGQINLLCSRLPFAIGLLPAASLVVASLVVASLVIACNVQAVELKNNPFSQPQRAAVVANQNEVVDDTPATPPETIELKAIILSGRMPMVNVSGEILQVGETLDGLELIAVQQERAIFLWQGNRYGIEMGSNRLERLEDDVR